MKRRSVVQCGSELNPLKPTTDWLDKIELTARAYIELDPGRAGTSYLKHAEQMVRSCKSAIEDGRASAAARWALGALQAIWKAEIVEGYPLMRGGISAYRKNESENIRRAEQKAERDAALQAAAEQIRKRRPGLSDSAIAKAIRESGKGFRLSTATIRKSIAKRE